MLLDAVLGLFGYNIGQYYGGGDIFSNVTGVGKPPFIVLFHFVLKFCYMMFNLNLKVRIAVHRTQHSIAFSEKWTTRG
jgi:hypothetical protein